MTIAILAHDSRKELALQFCTAYSGILSRNTVIATGTTGRMLAQAIGQNLLRLCDMHSVPISTNIATAEVLLRGLDQGDLDYREGIHPDIVEPLPVHRAVC